MTRTSVLALPAAAAFLAVLALLALPLAAAQHGPPPGYTDPIAYAQDYAANQTAQAQADPVGYAGAHTTPAAVGNESSDAVWLACWTAWYETSGMDAVDPVCSRFFTAPQRVDAPADDAHGEITGTMNQTDALLSNVTGAADAIAKDPTSAPEQAKKVVDAVVAFLRGVAGGLLDAVQGVLDLLGLGGLGLVAAARGALDLVFGLLGLAGLGLQSAASGIGSALGAVAGGALATAQAAAAGVVATASAIASGIGAAASGVADAAGALAHGVASTAQGIGSGLLKGGQAAGSAASGLVRSVQQGVSDTAGAVHDAVAKLLSQHKAASPASGARDLGRGLPTGQDKGILDRLLGAL